MTVSLYKKINVTLQFHHPLILRFSVIATSVQNNKNTRKLFKSVNRFEILSTKLPDKSSTNEVFNQSNRDNDKTKLPPSVFVRGVADFTRLCTKLVDFIVIDNLFFKSSTDNLKI